VSAAVSPTDVPETAHRALAFLDPAEQHRLALHWADDLPAALADPGLLERVIENLVSNALRHAPGPVIVSAGPAAGRIELRVADRGPGVRPPDRDRLFAPFQRLGDSPSGQGLGLGLAVARGLSEAMGGTLLAEDTPGGGLTMVLSLAAVVPPEPAPRPEPVTGPQPAAVPAP
jgi:two-component system sensor histidine kinase KdpD